MIKDMVNPLRVKVGVPALTEIDYLQVPYLNMFSNQIFARPQDWPQDKVLDSSYWIMPFDEESHVPEKTLAEFLEAGSAPLYIGFGSMPVKDPLQLFNDFCEITKELGLRGVYYHGTNSTEGYQIPEHVFLLKGAPHQWLFPRCIAAIHHGGAGTTAACLLAGIPCIIFPVLIDQPFWATQMANLKVGPPLPICDLKNLTKEIFKKKIEESLTEEIKKNAKEMAEKLKQEKGTELAVEAIKNFYKKNRHFGVVLDWEKDESVKKCPTCSVEFGLFTRRHHCRACGKIFCSKHLQQKPMFNYGPPQLLCEPCIKTKEESDSK